MEKTKLPAPVVATKSKARPTLCQTVGVVAILATLLVAAGVGTAMYMYIYPRDVTRHHKCTTQTTPIASSTSSVGASGDCGMCGPEINLQLRVEDQLEASVNASLDLVGVRQRELIFLLQTAADKDKAFTFSAKYYAKLGFMITSVNGLEANSTNQEWWKLTDGSGTSLKLGVSSYVPKDGETIVFSLVKGWGH